LYNNATPSKPATPAIAAPAENRANNAGSNTNAVPIGTSTVDRSCSSARNCFPGLSDDDSVDAVDRDSRLDDGEHPLVFGGVDDDDARVRCVAVDEVVELRGDRAVGPDRVLVCGGDNRDDRFLTVVSKVTGDAQRLQQAVDAGVFGIAETRVGHERAHGLPAGDRHRDVRRLRYRPRTVHTDDQRRHTPPLTALE
jgi:hypothetical protein